MSAFGLSEFQRWAADYRTVLTDQPMPTVTDDLVAFQTVGGFMATAQYQVLTPPETRFKITPENIPGRALVWHEMEHDRHWRTIVRVTDQQERALLRELYAIRGADPSIIDSSRSMAKEQSASMLPEAFIGEWGGYTHPIYGLNPDPAVIAAYASTPTAAAVRAFYLGMPTWQGGLFMAKWISGDIAIQLDASGNAIVITPIPAAAGFLSGQLAACDSKRIGLPDNTVFLPIIMPSIAEDTTKAPAADGRFYVRSVVRGDPQRPGPGYLKVSAWQ